MSVAVIPRTGALGRLRGLVRAQSFRPGPLGVLVNPFYIIRKRLLGVITQLAPRVQGRVLDFGCGSKPYRSLFAHCPDYVGIDLEVSGHDHTNSVVDIFFDGRTIPFEPASFDALVSFEVIEHVPDAAAVVQEWARVVRDGGTVLITAPFAWDEHEQPYDFARYTSFGMTRLLQENGFTVETMVKSNHFVEAIGQLVILYAHYLSRGCWLPVAALVQFGVVAPLTCLTLVLGRILPRKDTLYSNLVVLARRNARG